MTKRPHMSMKVKLDACLLRLGLDPDDVEWDHDPALELRQVLFDVPGQPYLPDANDPRYIVPRSRADHKRKTNGPGGDKRITTRGGDHGDAAHLRAMTRKESEFILRVAFKAGESFTVHNDTSKPIEIFPPTGDTIRVTKRKIPSRPFLKRKREKNSRKASSPRS